MNVEIPRGSRWGFEHQRDCVSLQRQRQQQPRERRDSIIQGLYPLVSPPTYAAQSTRRGPLYIRAQHQPPRKSQSFRERVIIPPYYYIL